MNETINITKDTEDAKFEDFVKQSENSLIYQSKNYLDLVADYLKSEKGYIRLDQGLALAEKIITALVQDQAITRISLVGNVVIDDQWRIK